MECADPDIFCAKIHNLIYTFPHLPWGLVCKCNGQNIPLIDLTFINQIGNPVGQHSGLAWPGPCQNKKRSFCMIDRFLLDRIQWFIYTHSKILQILYLSTLFSTIQSQPSKTALDNAFTKGLFRIPGRISVPPQPYSHISGHQAVPDWLRTPDRTSYLH